MHLHIKFMLQSNGSFGSVRIKIPKQIHASSQSRIERMSITKWFHEIDSISQYNEPQTNQRSTRQQSRIHSNSNIKRRT